MYLKKDDLYYSVLYGSGVYSLCVDGTQDPITGERSAEFFNVLHQESFFSRAFGRSLQKEEFDNYKRLVLSVPDIKNILWPKDLVAVGKEQAVGGVVKLDNVYAYDSVRERVTARDYVLLFDERSRVVSTGLDKYLEELEQRYGGGLSDRSEWQNYRNPEILSLARTLVATIDKLNREGYLYLDFHPSRLRIINKEVYLDFSNLIYDMENIYRGRVCKPVYEKLPIEFIEPELYNDKKRNIDFAAQNYSLASVLFYLLVGRHAYDGMLRAQDIDDSLYNHYIKFGNMCLSPIFIFDEQDRANHPGHEARDEALLKRWEAYPKELRYMFTKALARKVEYKKEISYRYQDELPTPKQWLDQLDKL